MIAEWLQHAWATAAHPYSLEVDELDIIGGVVSDSLRIERGGPGQSGSMSFTYHDADGSRRFTPWQHVTFTEHAAARPRLFGGFVQSARVRGLIGAARMIEVECVGYGILLDRRVVVSEAVQSTAVTVGDAVLHLVNRYGGMMSGKGYAVGGTPWRANIGDVSHRVLCTDQWLSKGYDALSLVTLRAALESWTARAYTVGSGYYTVAEDDPGVFWVDDLARLHYLPASSSNGCGEEDGSDFDGLPLYVVGDSADLPDPAFQPNQCVAVEVDHELESTGLVTSVRVTGTGAGTAWWRMAPQGVAGDLECAVTDSNAGTAALSYARAVSEMARRGGGTTRGTFTTVTTTPLDVAPGKAIRVTLPALAGETVPHRATSVSIRWLSDTAREYTVGFGDLQPNPSAMNHSGRFRERPSVA